MKKTSKIRKYRSVSILNGISKIYGSYIHNSLSPYAETILLNFISAYKKSYSSNHVLSRLIENWKRSRDNKYFVGTVILDLSKAFDCISHDLLAEKLHAYGLSEDALTFVHKVARVVNLKLAFTGLFFYNLIIIIKLCKI